MWIGLHLQPFLLGAHGAAPALAVRQEELLGGREAVLLLIEVEGLALGILGSYALRSVIAALVSNTVGIRVTATASLLGTQTASISIAGAAMLVSAMAASLIPARRAATLEPAEALRAE